MSTDEHDIRSACTAYGDAMRAMDLDALKGLWDHDFEHLVYQPEEHGRPCRTWSEIVDYWSYIPGAVDRITQWRELDIDVAVIGDAALVYQLVASSFQLAGVTEPLEGEVRFTYGLRRAEDGWRFVHCHESRQLIVED